MKTKNNFFTGFCIFVMILILFGYAGCKAIKERPNDDAKVTLLKFENIMGDQYAELLPVWGNGIRKELEAGVYNTIGLNTPDGKGNTAPDEILAKLDLDKLAKEYNAFKVIKNAPRFWTVDWVEVYAGETRDFDGLKAHWVMWFPIPESMAKGEAESPYNSMKAIRNTHMGIRSGSPAFILDDPEGNSWVMKSASRIDYPEQKFEDLQSLGSRLKLPSGWSFRYVILEKELIFQSDNGNALITQDDFGNTYDRVGGPYSNYKP